MSLTLPKFIDNNVLLDNVVQMWHSQFVSLVAFEKK